MRTFVWHFSHSSLAWWTAQCPNMDQTMWEPSLKRNVELENLEEKKKESVIKKLKLQTEQLKYEMKVLQYLMRYIFPEKADKSIIVLVSCDWWLCQWGDGGAQCLVPLMAQGALAFLITATLWSTTHADIIWQAHSVESVRPKLVPTLSLHLSHIKPVLRRSLRVRIRVHQIPVAGASSVPH